MNSTVSNSGSGSSGTTVKQLSEKPSSPHSPSRVHFQSNVHPGSKRNSKATLNNSLIRKTSEEQHTSTPSLPIIAEAIEKNHTTPNSSLIPPFNFKNRASIVASDLISVRRLGSKGQRNSISHDTVSPVKALVHSRYVEGTKHSPKRPRELTKMGWASNTFDAIANADSEDSNANGILEVWPANVDRDGTSNSNSLMVAKPKVLQELERFLEQSLIRHRLSIDSFENGEDFDIAQTQPYRECFRTYTPAILLQI
jgi:hypothetical protein